MATDSRWRYNFNLFNQPHCMRYLLDSVEYDSVFGEFRYQDQTEKLSAMGTRVFNFFLDHPADLISYDELMDKVWNRVVSENAVLQIITHIRQTYKKLNGEGEIIKNFRGKGFQLNQNTPIQSIPEHNKTSTSMIKVWWILPVLLLGLIVYLLFIADPKKQQHPEQDSTAESTPLDLQALRQDYQRLRRQSLYFWQQGQIEQAEKAILQLLDITQQLNNNRGIMDAYSAMVQLTTQQGQFTKAHQYLGQLITLADKTNSLEGQTRSKRWLTRLALEEKDLESAIQHLSEYQKQAEALRTVEDRLHGLLMQLDLALMQNQLADAAEVIEHSKEYVMNDDLLVRFKKLYADWLVGMDQPQQAIRLIEEAIMDMQDEALMRHPQALTVKLAELQLSESPDSALVLLQQINLNENNAYPYHWLLAQAYAIKNQPAKATQQLKLAQAKYHQRWSPEMQQLADQLNNQ